MAHPVLQQTIHTNKFHCHDLFLFNNSDILPFYHFSTKSFDNNIYMNCWLLSQKYILRIAYIISNVHISFYVSNLLTFRLA